MRDQVLIKVYGAFEPVNDSIESSLSQLLIVNDGSSWWRLDGQMVHIEFEGMYFPVDDALDSLRSSFVSATKGKLDVLDIEAWEMTRYIFEEGTFKSTLRNINDVLAFSGF